MLLWKGNISSWAIRLFCFGNAALTLLSNADYRLGEEKSMKYISKQFGLIIAALIIINIFSLPLKSERSAKQAGVRSASSEVFAAALAPLADINEITEVELISDKSILGIGDTANLTFSGIYADGSAVDLTMGGAEYISSDPEILKVGRNNNKIQITALASGECYVLASIFLNGIIKRANIQIEVVKVLSTKKRSTYYTEDKIESARKNIKEYAWAKTIKDQAVDQANKYLRLGYQALWNMVTPQSIPRSYAVNQSMGCPNCGREIDRYGHYPYLADPLKSPWKIECPNCHLKFPTNDFQAYYESGKDKHGVFNPDLANKDLLVNKLYPEKGRKWGVDDGSGYKDENGKIFTFIAYYNHWALWDSGAIEKALSSFRDAYVYTGDIRYARAGIALLDRIADVYPDMDISAYKTANGYMNSDGGSGRGKVVGCIWETELVKDFLKAYDAFFPAFDDPVVIKFLRGQSQKYSLAASKNTAYEIKKNIEDGIVRQIYPAIRRAQIRGNNGMHQSVLALAAVVIDTLPETREWLDFDFQAGTATKTNVSGGNILASLVNDVDRDGNGNEASPQYNSMWLSQYMETADILKGYDLYPAADLYKNVKFRKMFYAMYPLILSDIHSALIGDSGSTGSPADYLDKQEYVTAFEQLGDPLFAQIVYFLNNNKTDGIGGDIFSPDPVNVELNIRKVIDTYGTLKLNSTNLTGYGLAVLRDGSAGINFQLPDVKNTGAGENSLDTQRSLWMYYGRNTGHGHSDTLNLGMNAFKLDLLPELGYPEFADETPNRMEWVRNTVSHNTVVVDKTRQSSQTVSEPLHFDDSGMVKLIDVEAPQVYPQTSLYRRTTAMIRVDDENSYAVDFFRVNGGNDHYFSFHSGEGSVATEGLKFVSQVNSNGIPVGTYSGPEVEFGIRPENDSIAGYFYSGSGFQWLKNVRRDDAPGDSYSVDWKLRDTWNIYGKGFGADTDIHLNLIMLGKIDDAALADGIPPQNKPKNPKSLRYFIAHRHGQNLSSLFTSIIVPYKQDSFIQSVSLAQIKAEEKPIDDNVIKAIKVVFKNGRVDYIINSLDQNIPYIIDDKIQFKGFFGVYSEKDGKQVYGYLNDGTVLGTNILNSQPGLTGTVQDFTQDMNIENQITASFDSQEFKSGELIGKYIYIKNDGARNAVYQIKGIKKADGKIVTLDIGDTTPIRSFKDVNNFSKGYIYDITRNAPFVIPLNRTWSLGE